MHFRVLSCFTGKMARYHKMPVCFNDFQTKTRMPRILSLGGDTTIWHGSFEKCQRQSICIHRARACLARLHRRHTASPHIDSTLPELYNLTYSVYSNLPSWAFLSTRECIPDILVYCTALLYVVACGCFRKVCTAHVWDGDDIGSLASHIVYEQSCCQFVSCCDMWPGVELVKTVKREPDE